MYRHSAGASPQKNDLVLGEAQSSAADLRSAVEQAVRDLLPELLPKPRGIAAVVDGETAKFDAVEVLSKTYGQLVAVVEQLVARMKNVSDVDAFWAIGVPDESASRLREVAAAAPRQPRARIESKTLDKVR